MIDLCSKMANAPAIEHDLGAQIWFSIAVRFL